MKKTRIFSLLIIVILLVGCAKNENNGKEKTTTIRYATWGQVDEYAKVIEEFEKDNPNIIVEIESSPWAQYWTKMEAAATGGSLPDVFWMHSNEAYRYMSSDILMDLSSLVKESELLDITKFPSEIVELYTYEGKNYAIPKDVDTHGLWYNKEIFDSIGLEYPDEHWNWQDLKESAKKLTNKEKGIYGFATELSGHGGYYNFMAQNNGKILSEDRTESRFNSPENIEAIQYYADFSLKDKSSPTIDELSENDAWTRFQSGKLAMGIFGTWMTQEVADSEYLVDVADVTVLPKGKKHVTMVNGLSNAVAKGTKNGEAALKFIEFLGSKKVNEILALEGTAIPAYEGTSDAWVAKYENFNSQSSVDSLEFGQILPYSNETIKVVDAENNGIREILEGKISVEEGVKKINQEVNELLK